MRRSIGLPSRCGLVLLERLQVVEAADEQQVGDLLDDLERVGDAAGPEGVPDAVDLALELTGDHARQTSSAVAGRRPVPKPSPTRRSPERTPATGPKAGRGWTVVAFTARPAGSGTPWSYSTRSRGRSARRSAARCRKAAAPRGRPSVAFRPAVAHTRTPRQSVGDRRMTPSQEPSRPRRRTTQAAPPVEAPGEGTEAADDLPTLDPFAGSGSPYLPSPPPS